MVGKKGDDFLDEVKRPVNTPKGGSHLRQWVWLALIAYHCVAVGEPFAEETCPVTLGQPQIPKKKRSAGTILIIPQ